MFFVLRICGRIVHNVWVACVAWWRPALQLLSTGVPRANFRRGVQRAVSRRVKVITVYPSKLESSNLPRVKGQVGCLIFRSFLRLAVSRFVALARPRDYGSPSGGMVDDPRWRHALYSVMHRQSGPSLLCAGQWSKMGLVVACLAEDGICPRCKEAPDNVMHHLWYCWANEQYRLQLNFVVPAAASFSGLLASLSLARAGIPPAGWDVFSLEEFKCLLNYLWCCAADGPTALAGESRGLPEAPPFAFDRVPAERSMITPFWVSSAPMPLPRPLRPRRRKTPGSPVPFDPDCCYLYVDGSYEPAVEDSPEKCGWGLHVVRARFVQGQFCGPTFCGLLRENTRVFKLSNNLAELVALFTLWSLSFLSPQISTA